ncbi:hypothetical protein [Paraburkholderia sp. ZP32-5]|nr:hypothetical protein [Paraburkholderia sp. ZP32-5]
MKFGPGSERETDAGFGEIPDSIRFWNEGALNMGSGMIEHPGTQAAC